MRSSRWLVVFGALLLVVAAAYVVFPRKNPATDSDAMRPARAHAQEQGAQREVLTGAPIATRVQSCEPDVKAAAERLWKTWERLGYRHRLKPDILTLRPGCMGGILQEGSAPSEWELAVRSFNTSVWSSSASLLALAELLGEETNIEKCLVIVLYLNFFRAQDRNLKSVLEREGCCEMVARLLRTENIYAWHVLLAPLGLQGQLTQRLTRTGDWMSQLPLDAPSAEALVDWYGRKRVHLGPGELSLCERAIAETGHFTPKLLEFYLAKAEDTTGTGYPRSAFVVALAEAADVSEEAARMALRFVHDPDEKLREDALYALLDSPRMLQGESDASLQLMAFLQASATRASTWDDQIGYTALLAQFDKTEMQVYCQEFSRRGEDAFLAYAQSVENRLLGRSHGFKVTRDDLYRYFVGVGRSQGSLVSRRAAYTTSFRLALALANDGRGEFKQRAVEILDELDAIADSAVKSSMPLLRASLENIR